MKQIYFLFASLFFFTGFNGFSQNCNDLEILTTTDGSVCGGGSVTLSATATGIGDDIFWYNTATGGNYLGAGSVFETPKLTATTSYWASEVFATGITWPGQAKVANTGTSSTSGTNWGLVFSATQSFTLVDVEVFSAGAGGALVVELQDATGVMIQTATVTVPGGGTSANPVPFTVPLNFNIPAAGSYRLIGVSTPTLIRDSTGNTYPYPLGTVGQVTSGYISGTSTSYYWFFNWTVSTGTVTCESPRKEVVATVNNVADEDITALPYTHTANTATYFNNYSGAPGSSCGTDDEYLNGNDVVYKYTANDNYILNVELSGLSEAYSGVFVYNSCSDIGTSCASSGSINTSTSNHSFQVAVQTGNSYYFVVSSADPTAAFNYTLTINGTTCSNYPAPTGAAAQNFITGQTLADLDVSGPNITWYSDAAKTTVLPSNTALVNATTYYATQTFQGCEGNILAVTVTEVPCTALEVLTTSGDAVCGEGSVTLTAQGAGPATGTEIYWYETATGGDKVGYGSSFTTPKLTQTTSYWAAEVALSGALTPGGAGPLPTYCIPSISSGCSSDDTIDDLTIKDPAGNTVLSHLGSGCSPNGYGNFTTNANLSPTLEAGVTYSFTITHGYSSQRVKIWIDFNKDGLFDDIDELLFASPSGANPTLGSFTIPQDADGTITAMRVFNNFSSLPTNSCTSGSTYGEVHDYKVTIVGTAALCESPRKEVIATVNNVADEMVTEPLPFTHSASTSTYGNNYSGVPGAACNTTGEYLNGNDVVYQFSPTTGAIYSVMLSNLTSNNASIFVYESCADIGYECYAGAVSAGTNSNFGLAEVPMFDGHDYFIVISTKTSPSTDYTLTIDLATISCSNYTAAPDGDANQFFETGDTLDDLVVNGGNLAWFSDAAGTTSIPSTTLLVDGSTYYVNQTLNTCVSDLLAITVTKIDCSNLEILTTTDGTIVCKGSTVLEATGNGGLGTEIYWYDANTGGNLIAIGPTYTTPILTNTQSYWVSEVFLETGTGSGGPLPTYCVPTFSTGCTSSDTIDDLIITDQTGSTVLSHLGSGCSPNGYGNFTGDASLSPIFVAGQVYDFTINHDFSSQRVKIWIDFNKDGVFDDTDELLFASPSGANPTLGSFTIPQTAIGTSTAMRVFNNYSSLPTDACTSGSSFGEVHDYKVTIVGASVLCESPRKEVIATVSQNGDIIVPSALPYIDANNNTTNYGNTFTGLPGTTCGTTENYLNGDDVVYMYTPSMNDVVDIILKDITGFYAGIFVYESCGDIGTNCVAGKVAGASTNNLEIKEFDMVAGQTYYIVVSSWLTSNIGYTLEIKGFDCSLFPAPTGDAAQDFVAPATVADLVVSGTMTSSVLNWYSDAAGTISIPETTTLVDATTYYVSQTFGTCEGPLLAITVSEIDCSDLEILTTVGGTVTCMGSTTLTVTSSGTGSDIYWYNSATAADPIAFGPSYTTPTLTTTTSYWASEVLLESGTGSGGPLPTYCIPSLSIGCTSGDLIDDFTIKNSSGTTILSHLGTGCSPNAYGNYTSDANLTVTLVAGQTYDFSVVANFSSQRVKIWIDLDKDGNFNNSNEQLYASPSGANPTNGSFTIPQNAMGSTTVMRVFDTYSTPPSDACSTSGSFGEVHDYKVIIVGASKICESPRKEVIATVNQTGDKVVGALNYTDTDSTINFGNNFSGAPGCGITGNYLDGNDVVYKYSPTADNIINIELTGISNSKTGVFVYESCGDVGGNCLAGTISNGGIYLISDFYVTAGEDYFIVIASETGSTSYTLNIYGYDCATDLNAPTGDASQYFVGTKDLTDLVVNEYVHSTGLNWYSDAAGTISIPETTTLVDNTTYYVSQTVLGCESDLLAITAQEFNCSDLDIVSTTSGATVCQSGSVTLTAQSSGIGNDIYWYSSNTSTSPINIGSTFTTPNITTTTSYWVAEVYTEGGTGSGGPLPTYCIPTFSVGCTSGDLIDDFILKTQSGNTLLSHLGSGCSPNAYGDYTSDPNLTATLVAGLTYDFTSVANFSSQRVKIWIDLNKDGVFDDTRELLYSSPSGANPTNGSFTIPFDAIGNTTVMRVFDSYSSLPANACSSNSSFGEVHDYKVTIVGASILCESTREEVIVTVNTTLPPAPVGDATQNVCGADSTLADLVVIGDNIKWYDANGSLLSLNTVVRGGESYFATQTVASCEGPKLEVAVVLLDKSDKPIGDRNQAYFDGETLADLDVIGDDLLWYGDQDRMIPLPDTTLLVDQATYYVSQTLSGFCESDLLAITVHRVLGVNDPAFANVMVLPNPASDRVTISNNGPIESVELYNLLGQRVLAQSAGFQTQTVMDVSFLSSGTYLLNVKIDGKTGIFKVIKE